jgi:hypothetical protein
MAAVESGQTQNLSRLARQVLLWGWMPLGGCLLLLALVMLSKGKKNVIGQELKVALWISTTILLSPFGFYLVMYAIFSPK